MHNSLSLLNPMTSTSTTSSSFSSASSSSSKSMFSSKAPLPVHIPEAKGEVMTLVLFPEDLPQMVLGYHQKKSQSNFRSSCQMRRNK